MPKQRKTAEKPIPQVHANPDTLLAAVLQIPAGKADKKPAKAKKR